MVIILTGATHTGKTAAAQRILESYAIPYLSADHLKMGLIRSKQTNLTPEDDAELTEYLWPIEREIIKTAIENRQNLTLEGGYIPCGWEKDFDESYRKEIRFICLVMSENYISEHFQDIRSFAGVIEDRGDDPNCTQDRLIAENRSFLTMCEEIRYPYILIDGDYKVEIKL